MEPFFTLPIRFQYRLISNRFIPTRSMIHSEEDAAQFGRLMDRMAPLCVDELAQYLSVESFTRWERASVQLSLAECRLLALYTFIRHHMIAKAKDKQLRLLASNMGMHVTPKDLADRRRFTMRLVTGLYHDKRREETVYKAARAFVKPCVRQALRESDSIAELLKLIAAHYFNSAAFDRDHPEGPERDRIYKNSIHKIFLNLLLLHEDDGLISLWLTRFAEHCDPHLQELEALLWEGWQDLLYAAAFARHKEQERREDLSIRVKQLEQELVSLHNQYDADIASLLTVIEDLQRAWSAGRNEPGAEIATAIKPTLSGQRILVVGDESHAPQYRQLVEALGGVFSFVPGFDKDHSLHSRLQGADAVVFVTAYASHLKFYATKARLDNRPMALVNQAGLAAFGRGLDELRERLTRAERKVL
ncbi:MAG: DUF2325 domain-containing protein [Bacilli bacterium]